MPMVSVVPQSEEYSSGAVGRYLVLPRRFLLVVGVALVQVDRVDRFHLCATRGRTVNIGSALLLAYCSQSKICPFRKGTVGSGVPACGNSSIPPVEMAATALSLPSNKLLPLLAKTTLVLVWARGESAVVVGEGEASATRVRPKYTREVSSPGPRVYFPGRHRSMGGTTPYARVRPWSCKFYPSVLTPVPLA